VCEQFIRLLHYAGMPKEDADYIHGNGKTVNEILIQARPRSTLFTGSGRIAEKLAHDLHGKVRLPPGVQAWDDRKGISVGSHRRCCLEVWDGIVGQEQYFLLSHIYRLCRVAFVDIPALRRLLP
jgi:hypothetical protein